jgi:hypothetical protein
MFDLPFYKGDFGKERRKDMWRVYTNCTHINGNLILVDLRDSDLVRYSYKYLEVSTHTRLHQPFF